jgi:xylan 1,4-beta-xylosidase
MTQLYIDLYYRSPLEAVWTFGGNVSHAYLLRRPDVQRQMQVCHDELALRYLRCHDFFGDRMEVLRPDGGFDYDRIDTALDGILRSGLTPFIGLSGMPAALAADPQAFGANGIRNGPPNDWNKWYEMVYGMLGHLDERYGCDVREWQFEAAPGPDLPHWAGTREEYFRMYDRTVRAVKALNCDRKAGICLADRPDLLDAFLAHLAQPSPDYDLGHPRCDFITLDGFPGVAVQNEVPVPAAAVASGETESDEPPAPDPVTGETDSTEGAATSKGGLRDRFDTARKKIIAALGGDVTLYCGAWNSSRDVPSLGHDHCNNAAFVAKSMAEVVDAVQGAMFWNISDIDEASAAPSEPFHGGCGLLTVNDVRKSAFNAMKLLRDSAGYHTERLGLRWTDPIPGLGAIAIREEYMVRLLVWYYRDPNAVDQPTGPVRFTLDGLPPSIREAQLQVIRPAAGSAFEAWVELGRPQYVTREILEILEMASQPASAEVDFVEYPPRLEPGMVMQFSIQLPFGESE